MYTDLSDDNILPFWAQQMDSDEETQTTWRDEAAAVIKDVRDHLKGADISHALESTESQIFLNITTLEEKRVTVRLSCQGFAVVCPSSHDLDESSSTSLEHHETLYSLLNAISPAYTDSFGKALGEKLSRLQQQKGL